MSLAEANKVGEIVSEKMSSEANVIWGARVDPRLSGILRVMLILTGVKSPQLLARSKEETVLSSATRRLAEYGVISSQTTLGSREARARSFGKLPESTERSWEDRLKPLERTLARKPREKEDKKREIEELGLRRLL